MKKFARFREFLPNRDGSIIPIFAFMLTPLLIAAGVAVDYAQVSKYKTKMVTIADAAILAAAVEAQKLPDLKDEVAVKAKLAEQMEAFLKANTVNMRGPEFEIKEIKYDTETQGVELKLAYSFDTNFMKITGVDEVADEVETAVFLSQDEQQAISMYLVLDRSGSMNTRPRERKLVNGRWRWVFGDSCIDSLKNAVTGLHNHFEQKDPENKYVRTGAVAYQSRVQGRVKLDWGSAHVDRFTRGLRAGGGTQAFNALSRATAQLSGNAEEQEHAKKNKSDPRKYIVFMTDGADHRDANARRNCDRAKDKEIEIFTVAFQAPTQGKELLKYCASSESHYFNADNSAELMDAFQKIGEAAARELAIAK